MLDLSKAFGERFESGNIEIRSPHDPEWGYDPAKWTASQEELWTEYMRQDAARKEAMARGDRNPPHVRLAMIGGKGSGKTFAGAMIAAQQAQQYPGSIGMFCSNTFPQLRKSLVPHFKEVMFNLGYGGERVSYHTQITVHGRPYDKVFVVHLNENTKSFVVLTSFANIETIEGSEWDWQVYTELEHAERAQFAEVGITRLRGQKANRLCYIDAMPENADHWQYRTLKEFGFALWEPSLYENLHNVGEDYLDTLLKGYDERKARAFIHGERLSLDSRSVFYAFNHDTHVNGEMSRELCTYDPGRELVITVDFNLSPMCAAAFQVKPWYDAALDETYDVLAQVDEWEVWEGATRTVVEQILSEYGRHWTGVRIMGDRSGNTRNTVDPGTTDWDIVRSGFSHLPGARIMPGLVRRAKDGVVTYSNPPVRDTINRLNALLRDAQGRVRMCFLPESKFESGGLARSISRLQLDASGNIDKSVDRSTSRRQAMTHFADGGRYIAYWFTGGELGRSDERLKGLVARHRHSFSVQTNNSRRNATKYGILKVGRSTPSNYRF